MRLYGRMYVRVFPMGQVWMLDMLYMVWRELRPTGDVPCVRINHTMTYMSSLPSQAEASTTACSPAQLQAWRRQGVVVLDDADDSVLVPQSYVPGCLAGRVFSRMYCAYFLCASG